MHVRRPLNKAYLIIGVTAILVLAAMLSGPLIRRQAREKVKQSAPAAAAAPGQEQPGSAKQTEKPLAPREGAPIQR